MSDQQREAHGFFMTFLDEDIAYALKAFERLDQRGRERMHELARALARLKPGERISIRRRNAD
jgi:hypothetical protein